MARKPKAGQCVDLERFKQLCARYDTARKGYGYTSFRLRFNIPHSSMNRVIYEDKDFNAETYVKIAMQTGVSLDWMFGLSDNEHIMAPTFQIPTLGGTENE